MIQSHQQIKEPALTSEEDDFDLLFGQKEDSEAEGQIQSDHHLQHLQDELDRYLKNIKIKHLTLINGWGNVSFSGKMRNCFNFNHK